MTHKSALAEIDDDPVKQSKDPEVQAQLAWHQLKSRKGWTEATLVLILYEFVKSKGLFRELVKFASKR